MSANATPYSYINEVLDYFHKNSINILGNNFVGMYVYGSLAMGDFDPNTSDIDFIVISNNPVSEEVFLLLDNLHNQFYLSNSKWARKIEAAYITRDALGWHEKNTRLYPQIEKGKALTRDKLEMGWAFQSHTLWEYGIVVSGPDPKRLFDPVDLSHMINAAKLIAELWYQQAQDAKESAFLKEEDKFVILTLCRFLYLLHTKKLGTKSSSAQWAKENLDKKWVKIIDKILLNKSNNNEDNFQNTVDLIKYTADSLSPPNVNSTHKCIFV